MRCRICHKPLSRGRWSQGVRLHPGCRRSLDRDVLDAAVDQTRRALERLQDSEAEGDVAPLVAEAVNQAHGLLADLQQLKGYLAPAAREASR